MNIPREMDGVPWEVAEIRVKLLSFTPQVLPTRFEVSQPTYMSFCKMRLMVPVVAFEREEAEHTLLKSGY